MSSQLDINPPLIDTISSINFSPNENIISVSSWDKVY